MSFLSGMLLFSISFCFSSGSAEVKEAKERVKTMDLNRCRSVVKCEQPDEDWGEEIDRREGEKKNRRGKKADDAVQKCTLPSLSSSSCCQAGSHSDFYGRERDCECVCACVCVFHF